MIFSLLFLCISFVSFFKKQWFNILSLTLNCYIYWKFIRLNENQQETQVPFLAIFGTFSRNIVRNQNKRMRKFQFYNISASHAEGKRL